MESSNEFLPRVQIDGLEKSKKVPLKQNAEDGKKSKQKKTRVAIQSSNMASGTPLQVEGKLGKPSEAERFVTIDPWLSAVLTSYIFKLRTRY